MQISFDCIPCFVRQSLEAVRMFTEDQAIHERLLRKVLRTLSVMDLRQSPPAIAQRTHRLIRELTGQADPYREIKERFNRLALRLYPQLKERVENSNEPLAMAIRLAIAGNVIDMGVSSQLSDQQVHEAIEHALNAPWDADVDAFAEAVSDAKMILYLADNAGEIVFDKLLIQQLPMEKITVAVKGGPIINDATMADAEMVGMTELVKVVDNGSDAPGTILENCSESFQRRFEEADLVIAKGQGNYETLSDVPKDIFFILKAKCPVIANGLHCELGSLILRRSSGTAATIG